MLLRNVFFARHNFKRTIELHKRKRLIRKRIFDKIERAIINDKTSVAIRKNDFLFYSCESSILFDMAKGQDYYFKNKGYGFEIEIEYDMEKIVISW